MQSVAGDIAARIETLQDLIRQYSTSNASTDAALAVEAYKSEIRFLERKARELDFKSGGDGGGFGVPSLRTRGRGQAVNGMWKNSRQNAKPRSPSWRPTPRAPPRIPSSRQNQHHPEQRNRRSRRRARPRETERASYPERPGIHHTTNEINDLTSQIDAKRDTVAAMNRQSPATTA